MLFWALFWALCVVRYYVEQVLPQSVVLSDGTEGAATWWTVTLLDTSSSSTTTV